MLFNTSGVVAGIVAGSYSNLNKDVSANNGDITINLDSAVSLNRLNMNWDDVEQIPSPIVFKGQADEDHMHYIKYYIKYFGDG